MKLKGRIQGYSVGCGVGDARNKIRQQKGVKMSNELVILQSVKS